MIDFVKCRPRQKGFSEWILAHPALLGRWVDQLNSFEQKTGKKATYHALTWHVYDSGFVEVTGSLHKCWNSLCERGAVNWNDFGRLDLFDVLAWLQTDMGLNLHTATVHNVEFGVNLLLPPAPPTVEQVLTRLLFYGKGQPFVEKYFDPAGYERRYPGTDFYIKAYDKGTHQNAPATVLRFEKGVTAMKDLNGVKGEHPVVVTLADLNNPDRLSWLGTLLLTTFDKCFWKENFAGMALTANQQKTIAQAHNVADVAGLSRTQRNRLKDAYDQIANRLDYRLSTDLRAQISSKWNDLLEVDCNVLRRGGMRRFTRLKENVVKRYIAMPTNSPSTPGQTWSVIEGKRPTATDLRKNPALLAEVERGRKRYAKGSKESRPVRAAHLLRNDQSNLVHNFLRSLNRIHRQPVLFDVAGLVRLNAEQRGRLPPGHVI